uniref:PAP-associated domain-containing protein n=1 Tax=Panagrellus redivivus TaxID=6233 RepID=A0A7E4VYJ5_PANRE
MSSSNTTETVDAIYPAFTSLTAFSKSLASLIRGYSTVVQENATDVFNRLICLNLKPPQQAEIRKLEQAAHQITELHIGADLIQLFSDKWNLEGTSYDEKMMKQNELDSKLYTLASEVGSELVEVLKVDVFLSGSVQQGTANAHDFYLDFVAQKYVDRTQLNEEMVKLRTHTCARRAFPMKNKRVVRIEDVVFNGSHIKHIDITFAESSISTDFGIAVYRQSPRIRLLMTDVKHILKRLGLIDTSKNYISSCAVVVAVLSFQQDLANGKQFGQYDELFNCFCHYFGTFDFTHCAMHSEQGTIDKPIDTEFRAAVILEHLGETNVAERLQHAQLEVVQNYFIILSKIPHFDFMFSN